VPPSETLGVTALNPGACALFIIVGFTCAGGAHVIWLRSSFSRRFAVPIDLGVTLRGHRLFGDNKMWRGFLVIIPATAASFFVLSQILRGVGHSSLGLWPLGPAAYAGQEFVRVVNDHQFLTLNQSVTAEFVKNLGQAD